MPIWTRALSLCLAAGFLTTTALADPEGQEGRKKGRKPGVEKQNGDRKPRGPRGEGRPAPEELFQRLDKNDDQKLTADEVPERIWERMSKADENGDKAITKAEMKAAREKMGNRGGEGRPRGPRPDMGQLFDKMDKNGDDKLTADEIPKRIWERMSKADTNGDKAVTKEELKAAREKMGNRGGEGRPRGPRPDLGQMFDRMDKNGDDRLTANEVPAQLWERISNADANDDEAVTADELKAAREKRGERGPRDGRRKKPNEA